MYSCVIIMVAKIKLKNKRLFIDRGYKKLFCDRFIIFGTTDLVLSEPETNNYLKIIR